MADYKSTNLTNFESGLRSDAVVTKGNVIRNKDSVSVTAALTTSDKVVFLSGIPSNAVVDTIQVYNDDLDTDGTPTLAVGFGVAAVEKYTSVTSGVKTEHSAGDVIDGDLFIDGADTTLRAATTNWTLLTPDATTWGPEDVLKPIWELLGYDSDPITHFNIVAVPTANAAALASAADLSILVQYTVN